LTGNLEKARRYRKLAEELREIASHWIGDNAKNIIRGVARDYDVMAEKLEKRGSQVSNTTDRPFDTL
jgi:hypothetical protein